MPEENPTTPGTPSSTTDLSNQLSISKATTLGYNKTPMIIDLTSEDTCGPQQSPPVAQKLLSKAEKILAQCKQGLNSLNQPEEESLFGDDDDFLDNELMKIDESSVVTTPKKNSFFNNICSDLLKCSQNTSSKFGQQKRTTPSECNNNNVAITPRSKKRPFDASFSFSATPKDKRINTTTVCTKSEGKRLSKEEESRMEENRRKALTRRLQSLRRNCHS